MIMLYICIFITLVVDFDCSFNGETVEFYSSEDSVKMSYEGSQVLASVASSLIPIITSRSIISVDSLGELRNTANLSISFSLPSWFPIPQQQVESNGSQVIQTTMKADLDKLLDNILLEYVAWTRSNQN